MSYSIIMEQKYLKDFVLSRLQQMLVAIFLLFAILASSILMLRRIKEEREFSNIEVRKQKTDNRHSDNRQQTTEDRGQNLKTKTQGSVATQTLNPESRIPVIININKAGLNEFIKLPGIGLKLAERIIKYRKENGTFTSLKDIMKVKGMGKKKFEKCKDMIRVD
ncbi:MAG: helix-hairpin-helix domain-containing protein [bacterium]